MSQKLCKERWLWAGAGAAGEQGWAWETGGGAIYGLAAGGGEKTCWGCWGCWGRC